MSKKGSVPFKTAQREHCISTQAEERQAAMEVASTNEVDKEPPTHARGCAHTTGPHTTCTAPVEEAHTLPASSLGQLHRLQSKAVVQVDSLQ